MSSWAYGVVTMEDGSKAIKEVHFNEKRLYWAYADIGFYHWMKDFFMILKDVRAQKRAGVEILAERMGKGKYVPDWLKEVKAWKKKNKK